jgi:hypothetical protein
VTEFWSKRQVRTRLGFQTDAELARFFGISRSAVSQWPKFPDSCSAAVHPASALPEPVPGNWAASRIRLNCAAFCRI